MKITNIKINGLTEPLGMAFPYVSVSWLVTDTAATGADWAEVAVSQTPDFSRLLAKKEGNLSWKETLLDIALEPRMRYYIRIRVRAGEERAEGLTFFETGKMEEPWQGSWIAAPGDYHPIFRRCFSSVPGVGRIYVTAAGVFELYLNGEKVGRDLLAPFFNDYSAYHQVCTYELNLRRENTLEIHVGKGWYMGRFGLDGKDCNFGTRMAALAEIHLPDGTVLGTDSTWEAAPGDVVDSGIYDGEYQDRRRSEHRTYGPVDLVRLEAPLCDRISPPLCAQETFPVREVITTPKGETVLDFGQNFAGFVSFRADLPADTQVTLDFGEILQDGCFYNDNYRTAKSRFTYISAGLPETIRPHFTFFGFRYVRVQGMAVTPQAFTGHAVYSDMARTGTLETGNEKINRLIQNALWGLKSNFLDMPTDCPQRDERLGWTGDAQVFAPTASYLMDTRAFYTKFCKDLRVEQQRMGGGVPNYVPSFGLLAGACSVWGDVATFLPDTLLRQYGSRAQLCRDYSLMKDWVDYVHRAAQANGNPYLYHFGFHFGDWLAQDGITPQSMKGGTDDGYIASCYYCASADMTARAARELGREEDAAFYQSLHDHVRAAIFEEYFTATGRLAIDTQTGYIVALWFGIYPDREKLLEGFRERLRKDRFRIKGGFVGAPRLCTTLAEQDMTALAYDFLLQEEYPSWLYCVNLGATTIWERWNSVLPDGRISGTGMNSLNHYAYGSVVEFLYAQAAGIQPLENGFRRARIAPKPDIRLCKLACTYVSVSGAYTCRWEILADGQLELTVKVPFGCEAEVCRPGCEDVLTLGPGEYCWRYQPRQDYRKRYSLETRLDMLAGDPRAVGILFAKVPPFGGMTVGDDPEKASITLAQLPTMHYIPHDPAALQEAIAQILELT